MRVSQFAPPPPHAASCCAVVSPSHILGLEWLLPTLLSIANLHQWPPHKYYDNVWKLKGYENISSSACRFRVPARQYRLWNRMFRTKSRNVKPNRRRGPSLRSVPFEDVTSPTDGVPDLMPWGNLVQFSKMIEHRGAVRRWQKILLPWDMKKKTNQEV
jgi:hypothetical protein